MYYRSYVRSLLIYSHMHFDFRRWFESRVSLNYITLSIYFTDELWSHKSFGYACWCAKEFVVIQLYGNVSVVSCNHVTVIDTSSDVTDLFLISNSFTMLIFLLKQFGFCSCPSAEIQSLDNHFGFIVLLRRFYSLQTRLSRFYRCFVLFLSR